MDKKEDNINWIIKLILKLIFSIIILECVRMLKLSINNVLIISLICGLIFSLLDFVIPEISKSSRESFISLLTLKILKI